MKLIIKIINKNTLFFFLKKILKIYIYRTLSYGAIDTLPKEIGNLVNQPSQAHC